MHACHQDELLPLYSKCPEGCQGWVACEKPLLPGQWCTRLLLASSVLILLLLHCLCPSGQALMARLPGDVGLVAFWKPKLKLKTTLNFIDVHVCCSTSSSMPTTMRGRGRRLTRPTTGTARLAGACLVIHAWDEGQHPHGKSNSKPHTQPGLLAGLCFIWHIATIGYDSTRRAGSGPSDAHVLHGPWLWE